MIESVTIKMTSSNVNVGGMILNMTNAGFTIASCLREKCDNGIGAGATEIHFRFQTDTKKLIYADNGRGIPYEQLSEALCLHNRTEPNADKQGRFGIGGKAATINLTEAKGTSIIYTKNTSLCNAKINWAECVSKGLYQPCISEWDEDEMGIPHYWERYKIADQGFVEHIQCSDAKFRLLLDGLQSKKTRRTYHTPLGVTTLII